VMATPRVHTIPSTVVTSGETIVLGIVIGPSILLKHGIRRQWHTCVIHCQELLLVKVLLVLNIEPNVVNILFRDRQLVLALFVLRVVLHSLHLIMIALLVIVTLHHLVVCQ
jgi:hypothetical protein